MRYSSFYQNYSAFKKAKDATMTRDILLSEIAEVIVMKRERIIDKLNQAGIQTDSSISQRQLAERVMDNLSNRKFMAGLSSIIAEKNSDGYQSFNAQNGGKAKPKDYTRDIFFAINGTVKNADKIELVDKTEQISPTPEPPKKKAKPGIALAIIGGCALVIYLIGVQKIDLPKHLRAA